MTDLQDELRARPANALVTVTVDAAAMYLLLQATLDRSGALICQMMFSRGQPGEDNPIDLLLKDFNAHAGAQLNGTSH